ncbi:MAG: sulfotransferase [Fimbriimonas sp.]|nr:sulfotransferase [Fimbriimonas sp.]
MNTDPSGSAADHPDALFAQSMAAFQSKDFDRAVEFADRLLEISHGAGPAYVWGLRLRLEAGRWQDAIDFGLRGQDAAPGLCGLIGHAYEALSDIGHAQLQFERACREQPENPAWWIHNASALSRLYRDFESMESLERGIALSPNPDPNVLMILGSLQLTFGAASKAFETAKRALKGNPNVDGGRSLAARSLMALGRYDDAESEWAAAALWAPRDLGIPLQRAITKLRHGMIDVGSKELESLVQKAPKFVPALVQIATAKRFTADDRPIVAQLEHVLGEPSNTNEERIALRYALGKAYDNLKDYERAIEHFDEGNRLQYLPIESSGGFDRMGYTANMSLRADVYDRETVDELARSGDPDPSPIFVLGVIRSGTTLAEQILSAHPDVSGAGELDFWINADLRLMDYSARKLQEDELRKAAKVYARLLNGFAKDGATRVVDKQPGNLILAGALHIAFPNARIIHMQRHPIDTAISIWTTHIRTSTRFVHHKGNIVHAFREHERLMRHWSEVIPSDRFMTVQYEALVDDRERVTRQMLEFCGLDWNDVCLSPEKNQKQVITPSLWQVRQPVYRTSIGRWRHYEPWLGEFREMALTDS